MKRDGFTPIAFAKTPPEADRIEALLRREGVETARKGDRVDVRRSRHEDAVVGVRSPIRRW